MKPINTFPVEGGGLLESMGWRLTNPASKAGAGAWLSLATKIVIFLHHPLFVHWKDQNEIITINIGSHPSIKYQNS